MAYNYKQGETFIAEFQFTDEDGLPLDISNDIIEFGIFDYPNNATIFRGDEGTGVTKVDPINGLIRMIILDTDTHPIGRYTLEVQKTAPNGIRWISEDYDVKVEGSMI